MGGARTFDIYRGTQKCLIKSPYVIEAALRPPESHVYPASAATNPTPSAGSATNSAPPSPKTGEMMQVSLVGNDKEEITTLVNAVVDTYLSKVVDTTNRRIASPAR